MVKCDTRIEGKKMVNREIGFSLWLDFVERAFLQEAFPRLIEKGMINGATSNPSIFAHAITNSTAYQAQLKTLEGKSAKEKYEALAIEDIRSAAEALRPLYDIGNDGYISMEVDPFLSKDTEGTIAEGKRLFAAVGEPNVMIKVPATEAGYEAMEVLLGMGISINATLIFSPKQVQRCLKYMKRGIDAFEASGGGRVEAVISVFVSRFDRLLDSALRAEGLDVSKTGIYNAAKIYNIIEKNHTPSIRTLFASTGVKGDDLEADYYIRELLASHSINTAPLATIESYKPQSSKERSLPIDDEILNGYFTQLADYGFDMDEIYKQLLDEGVVAFEEAFSSMLDRLK